ncbi:transketolase [Dyella flava]|uniref:Transketolase n=1 Tax=Dyella flava TaxID=1920170 RepID=A0ABS2K2V1_9GAMM|nr:transketolase [Dyella flava]MBM7125082.1 transketolase [Dyella flava]GLQ51955.1 transketolase [Dyella flava]
MSKIDQQCIDTVRFLAVDMVEAANSGHPGLPLDAAPMAYVLWSHFLKHNPHNPQWPDRDRFVLSAGHGSALLYSLLFLTGYDLTLDDLKRFRQWGSKTPGHPERGHTPGVETTTGPLGQGFANAVGMAMAEAHLAARYNRGRHKVIDHYTYVLASDGDLMEGVASEAASLAGHLKLGKLICLYDDNRVTLAGDANITFTENRIQRFESYGWHTTTLEDGNDLASIEQALRQARREVARPSLIRVRTHIGFGSPVQDSYKAHGAPLGKDGVRETKEKYGWRLDPDFFVPGEVFAYMREAVKLGQDLEDDWVKRMRRYRGLYPDLHDELLARLNGELPIGWDHDIPSFDADARGLATREASGKIMNAIAPRLPALVGGSADLDPSTKTALDQFGDFDPPPTGQLEPLRVPQSDWAYTGRNIHFGVREHAMGAIVNGLGAHGGFIPYGATFLIFSDYMRPPIRLAALMGLHVIHVFTHDSIALGEDGPTHQPIEQLSGLRAMPNAIVIRPADANETAEAWKLAIETKGRPVLLALTRQKVPTLDRADCESATGLRQGGYILRDAVDGRPRVLLIASGSEVGLILDASKRLTEEGLAVRCISMPCQELFDALSRSERDEVLPPAVTARVAVEAGATQSWEKYTGSEGIALGIDYFGASASGDVLLRKYGFTVDRVCAAARSLCNAY